MNSQELLSISFNNYKRSLYFLSLLFAILNRNTRPQSKRLMEGSLPSSRALIFYAFLFVALKSQYFTIDENLGTHIRAFQNQFEVRSNFNKEWKNKETSSLSNRDFKLGSWDHKPQESYFSDACIF